MIKVVISKMFAGKFNEDSIGHEVINFIKPDNSDDSYIYIPPNGKSDEDVNCVVLVGKAENYAYPVLAIACEVESVNSNDEDKIRYGGNVIKKINFKEEDYNKKVGRDADDILNKKNLTYKVLNNSLKKTKEKIYIIPKFDDGEKQNAISDRITELKKLEIKYVNLGENPQYNKCYCECDGVNNKELYNLIQDAENWDNYPLKKTRELRLNIKYKDDCFLNFIEKENSEQIYTNMICKILNKTNKQCRKEFVGLLLQNNKNIKDSLDFDNIKEDFSVRKEKILKDSKYKGRMDLLIESSNLKIIIENKIKSDLNGIFIEDEIEKTQIDKYRDYLDGLCGKTKPKAEGLIFILKPNYSIVKTKTNTDVNRVIEYSELYDFFAKRKKWFKREKYFNEFINALAKQSFTKEQEINRRFLQTLK